MASLGRSIREVFSASTPPASRDEGSSGLQEQGPALEDVGGTCRGLDISLEPLAKRARSHARQSGFNKAWLTSFPWVEEVEGKGMLCKLCRKHNRCPQKAVVGKTTWVDVPCVTLTQNSLRRHSVSLSHLDAKKLEVHLYSSKGDGGIEQAFAIVVSAERKAMKAAMKCLYWLAKQKIPHTINFVGLLELVQSLGATYTHVPPGPQPRC